MHDHRNGGPPSRLPDPDSLEYRAQKVVLLELVVTPPPTATASTCSPNGSRSRRLDRPGAHRARAGGPGDRDGDVVRASAPALYFEYLWPVML